MSWIDKLEFDKSINKNKDVPMPKISIEIEERLLVNSKGDKVSIFDFVKEIEENV